MPLNFTTNAEKHAEKIKSWKNIFRTMETFDCTAPVTFDKYDRFIRHVSDVVIEEFPQTGIRESLSPFALTNNWYSLAGNGQSGFFPMVDRDNEGDQPQVIEQRKQVFYDALMPTYRALRDDLQSRSIFQRIFNRKEYVAVRDALKTLTALMLESSGDTQQQLDEVYRLHCEQVKAPKLEPLTKEEKAQIKQRKAERKAELRRLKEEEKRLKAEEKRRLKEEEKRRKKGDPVQGKAGPSAEELEKAAREEKEERDRFMAELAEKQEREAMEREKQRLEREAEAAKQNEMHANEEEQENETEQMLANEKREIELQRQKMQKETASFNGEDFLRKTQTEDQKKESIAKISEIFTEEFPDADADRIEQQSTLALASIRGGVSKNRNDVGKVVTSLYYNISDKYCALKGIKDAPSAEDIVAIQKLTDRMAEALLFEDLSDLAEEFKGYSLNNAPYLASYHECDNSVLNEAREQYNNPVAESSDELDRMQISVDLDDDLDVSTSDFVKDASPVLDTSLSKQ